MSLQTLQENNPALAVTLAIVLLAIPTSFITWWFWPREEVVPQKMAYFYDLNTNELIEVPAGTTGPVETDSGPYRGMPAGVRANVYSCGPLMEDTEMFIGYLEVPLEAVPEDQRPPGMKIDPEVESTDFVIRRPTDDQWYNPDTEPGLAIFREPGEKAEKAGKSLTVVVPFER